MELTLESVATDSFRRDFFLRCFSEREAQALELRFAFLHRVRQYKRLVGRSDLLPRAAKEIATSYLQHVESTDQLLLPQSAEPLRDQVLTAVSSGYCPLDLFCGMEALVRDHLNREAFPHFLRSPEYQDLCDALRARREVPLAEVLVDSRRTQFLMRFLSQEFPGEEGNLRFWVHVQTRFLPLIQTTLFSVTLFEEVQRRVRHVFNTYLVANSEREGDDTSSVATRVPEDVRRSTLQQIMRLQSEPFSPPRYANLFRAAQDCVWEWLQTEVYAKFRASTLYVMLVVEIEDLETDRQLRRLSEQVQATVKKSTSVKHERQSETIPKLSTRKSETQLKANAVVVPIKQQPPQNLWGQGVSRQPFHRVILAPPLNDHEIISISVASLTSSGSTEAPRQFKYELLCAGDQVEASADTHATHTNYWVKNNELVNENPPSPTKRAFQVPAAPRPTFHDFVLPKEGNTASNVAENASSRHTFGVTLTLWRQHCISKDASGSATVSTVPDSTITPSPRKTSASAGQYFPEFLSVQSTRPLYKKSRQLLLRLASIDVNNVTEAVIRDSLAAVFASTAVDEQLQLNTKYAGFYLQPSLRAVDVPLSRIYKEISSQTFVSILASILVGKSIILVSERSSALVTVGEALRELLKPFQFMDFYLPFCPVATAWEIRDAGLFSKANTLPFFVGFEGVLSYQKKDTGSDQRYRIRNNIYNIHKVSLQLQPPITAATNEYPPELLQSLAVVVDIDADDVYTPERVEIPELPQSLVRSLESMLSTALHSPRITQADSYIFRSSKGPTFMREMLEEPKGKVSLDSGARLALLSFLEALFGDVVYYFCSFRQNFAMDAQASADEVDEFLLFEVDSFLDAHTELGCRDFFRQFFHTELFRSFLLAQHLQFFSPNPNASTSPHSLQDTQDPETSEGLPAFDAFI